MWKVIVDITSRSKKESKSISGDAIQNVKVTKNKLINGSVEIKITAFKIKLKLFIKKLKFTLR